MSILEQRASGDSARQRRRQIERRLRELGWGRPRPWRPDKPGGRRTACSPRRLFEDLGPVFAACGLHLAPRLDLLPEEDCWELAAIADRGPPTPPEAVDELIRRELAADPEEVFAGFEPRPDRSALLTQSHRARSIDGEEVTVELVHPGVSDRLIDDLEDLRLLAAPLAARALPHAEARAGEALAEARDAIRDAADLSLRIDRFEEPDNELAGRDPAAGPGLPEVRFLTARLRIVMGWPQPTLAAVLENADPALRRAAPDLARHLWLRWLWQMLQAGRLPLDPRPRTIAVLESRWPAFTAADRRLPAAVREALTDYLTAMAGHDPDAACDAVSRLAPPGPTAAETRLRRRFRQLMPFRDSRRLGQGDTVAAALLLHQRLLGEDGFVLSPQLADFYRSLFWVHHSAQRLAPERELLAEALEELRWVAGLGELRRQLDLAQLAEDFKQQSSLWLELPQKLDAVLTRAARGAEPATPATGAERSRGPETSMVTAALLAAVVAVAVVGQRLSELGSAGLWGDKLGALLLLLVGAWFLTLTGRGKS